MPPLHRDEWRYGQTDLHRAWYPAYKKKKIDIWKQDKKIRQSQLKYAWAVRNKLKGRILAVKLRKKLPKNIRRVRRARKNDDAIDEVDDSDSGPTYRVFRGCEKQKLAARPGSFTRFGDRPAELT